MSTEEMKQLKEFITLNIQSVNAKAEYRSDIIENKISEMEKRMGDRLDKVDKHLEKQNGRIGKGEEAISLALSERAQNREHQRSESERLDKKIEEISKVHIVNCPQNPEMKKHEDRINILERESFSKKEMKKMFFYGLGIISTILIIAVNADKIINLIIK